MKRYRIIDRKKFNRFIALSILTSTLLIYILISLALPSKASGVNQEMTFTVIQGDNLWDIARAMNTGKDTRQVVHDIYKLNRISNRDTIYPGQVLKLPVY